MKAIHFTVLVLAGLACVAAFSTAQAREFGVSTSSYGRGTKVETERGGTAYVGPRGVAGETAGGSKYAAGPRRAGYSGSEVTAARGRYGAAATGPNGTAVAGPYGAAAASASGSVAVATRPVSVSAPLPAGYIRTVPAGYTTVVYGGYNCLFVGGVYYRPVIYAGSTVYVVVR